MGINDNSQCTPAAVGRLLPNRSVSDRRLEYTRDDVSTDSFNEIFVLSQSNMNNDINVIDDNDISSSSSSSSSTLQPL
jgi:hypothetical protein